MVALFQNNHFLQIDKMSWENNTKHFYNGEILFVFVHGLLILLI